MGWLTEPVEWQSGRTARYNLSAMTPEQGKMLFEPFLYFMSADWNYGQTTIEFFCAAIALCMLVNIAFVVRARRGRAVSGHNFVPRIGGFIRYFTARQLHLRTVLGDWYSPPLAAIVGVIGVFVFTIGLMLGKKPYYWPDPKMAYSQPVATRSGWIALAFMPFVIAFSTKINYIALITGTSHEKLQVFHRWLAAIMLIPSMVHTFPFIQMNYKNGVMRAEWYDSPFYWTGVVALVPQTLLVLFSWGIFRNRYYELFKKFHFLAAGVFLSALFIHVDWRLSSWHYFWATLALYASAYLLRLGRTLAASGRSRTAHISALPSAPGAPLVRVRIPVPAHVSWAPGQHVFVRFWGLGLPHALSSHPWTVASLPAEGKARAMELVLRARGGITAHLAHLVRGKVGVNVAVWVDGPYGGVPGGLSAYDEVVLLAGGSGSTFLIPILSDLAARKPRAGQQVLLVIALRDQADYTWMEDAIALAQQELGEALVVHIHVTGNSTAAAAADAFNHDAGHDEKPKGGRVRPAFVHGRPQLPAIVNDTCKDVEGRVAIVACGPDSFLYDVRKAVAERQLGLLRGAGGASDIFLHIENYSW